MPVQNGQKEKDGAPRLSYGVSSHVPSCKAALGGVPEIVVPDNLKAAVTRAHRYEPELNLKFCKVPFDTLLYGVGIITK